jgi:hypothetical protein
MTLSRPNAVIYQEYESIEVATQIPDLPALVVGPCYQILDYLDDKSDCAESTDYGEEDGTIPIAGSSTFVAPLAVEYATPSALLPGAELDDDSVKLFMDELRAVITEYGGAGAEAGDYDANDNVFKTDDGTGAGIHLGQAEVAAGDVLFVQSGNPAGSTADYKKTVKSLAYWFIDNAAAVMDLYAAGVAAGDLVTIAATANRNGVYTVKQVTDQWALETVEAIPGNGVVGGAENATVTITSPDGTVKFTNTVALNDWCYLRTTTDFATSDTPTSKWRIERELSDVEMDAADFTVVDNKITVKAGLTTDVSATLLAKLITFAEVYFEYMALRTDLAKITETTSTTARNLLLGKLDARNPLAVGAYVSSLNAPLYPINVYGIDDVVNEVTAYSEFIDNISTVRHLYTISPLTYNTTVLAALNNMALTMADPSYNLDHGTRQKFRMILGAIELVTSKYMQTATGGASTEDETGTGNATKNTGTFSAAIGATADMVAAGVVPGDIVDINSGAALYTVAHVNSALILEIDTTDGPIVNYSSLIGEVVIISAPGGAAKITLTSLAPADILFTGSAVDDLYTVLHLPNASFLTSGILPGDTVEIPSDPNLNIWTTVQSWVVTEVMSEERLRIVNNGTNTSTAANELPHGVKRAGSALVTQGSIYIRVARELTKGQQVTEMIAVAASFLSKRLILCYPDSVDISDLKDGSLPRSGSAISDAEAQPGYYLACGVGGMTASNPSQQGFTYKGIAGIDQIYYSSDYFNEQQMTDLSNGGVYVFEQESVSELPATIHEVTTDTTALQTGEYMNVKNVDFVSLTFLDTVLGFIGRWNVNKQTVKFIGQALQSDIGVLKARFVSRIGAPLIDASITSLGESEISSDRIEVYIDGDFPNVLNTIGVHLVA